MRDLIQSLIQKESEAKQIVEAARAEAASLIEGAQKQAQDRLNQGRTEARQAADKMIATAVEQALAEKEQALVKATAEIPAALQLEPAARDQIVQAVVAAVCGGPLQSADGAAPNPGPQPTK